MVKTYRTAPDFSTAPPPKGPIDLGHILKNVDELIPLNRRSRIAIPEDEILPVDEKLKFSMTRAELLKGTIGLFARFLALFGVGVEASISYEKDMEDVLTVERLETIAFNPSDAYLKESMQAMAVKLYLENSKYTASVYMITGMKIARGASLENKSSKSRGGKLAIGFNPPGVPIELGPSAEASRKVSTGISFQSSSDFVVALRIRQIKYRNTSLVHRLYPKGVTMEDSNEEVVEKFEVLGLGPDADVEGFESSADILRLLDTDKLTDTEDICWIFPEQYSF